MSKLAVDSQYEGSTCAYGQFSLDNEQLADSSKRVRAEIGLVCLVRDNIMMWRSVDVNFLFQMPL